MLVEQLRDDEYMAMVVYAGASGVVLDSTPCSDRNAIYDALDRLRSGRSTNGGAGIRLAYDIAAENFIDGGVNRVILATARDFNDDTKDAGEIGSGHSVTAFYEIIPAGVEIDLPKIDALKYQVSALDGTATGDIADADTVPERDEQSEPGAQAMGAEPSDVQSLETPRGLKPAAQSGELMTVKLRYKEPDGDTSKLIEMSVTDDGLTLSEASDDFAFAASVASFGMLLRGFPQRLPAHRVPAAVVGWPGKTDRTFSDAITAVRRWLWTDWVLATPRHHQAFAKLSRPIRPVLLYALAPAA